MAPVRQEVTKELIPGRGAAELFANPFVAMRRLSDEFEHLLGNTWGPGRLPPMMREWCKHWTPAVEMFERKGELVVRADLPGLTKEGLKVEIANDTLMIEGERTEEKEQKEKGYYTSERMYGSFNRAIPLPEGANAAEAKATFRDGVLEVTMSAPKAPEKHGRRLYVKVV